MPSLQESLLYMRDVVEWERRRPDAILVRPDTIILVYSAKRGQREGQCRYFFARSGLKVWQLLDDPCSGYLRGSGWRPMQKDEGRA